MMDDKKLNNLIKVGLGLIILSVLIFATNSWDTMSSILKVSILVLGSFLFYGLSLFTKKYLKLDKSSFVYYILSTVLLLFSFVALGYYNILGKWYSFAGPGCKLYISNIFIFISLIFYTYYKMRNNNKYLIVTFYMLIVSFFIFNMFLNLKLFLNAFIIEVLVNIIYYLYEEKLSKFHIHINIINYIVFFLTLYKLNVETIFSIIANIISLLLIIYNYIYSENKNNNIIEKIFIPIIIFISLHNLLINIDFKIILFILGILSILYYLLEYKYNNKNNATKYTLIILNNLILLVSTIAFCITKELSILYFILIIFSLIINLFYSKKDYLLIYKIILLVISIFIYISNGSYILFTLLIIFSILASTLKRKSYYLIFNILLVISVLSFNDSHIEVLYYILFPILIILNNILLKNYNSFSKYVWWSSFIIIYYLFEINLLNFELILNINNLEVCASIFIIIFYILLFYLSKKEKFNKIFTSVALLLPLYDLLYIFNNDQITSIIMFVYLIINALYFDIVEKENKYSKFLYIVSPLLLFEFGYINIKTFIFWIVTIIYMFIGYNNDKYKDLYKYGMILLIVSLLIDLLDLWISIPVYAYLFLLGIIIIVFSTKKELNKNNIKDNKVNIEAEKKKEIKNVVYHNNYCTNCGNKLEQKDIFCSICGNKIDKK